MWDTGMPIVDIALALDRTAMSINSRRRALKLAPRGNGHNGTTHPWPADDVDTLHALVAKGLGSGTIAKRMGRTRNSIITKRRLLKIDGQHRGWTPQHNKLATRNANVANAVRRAQYRAARAARPKGTQPGNRNGVAWTAAHKVAARTTPPLLPPTPASTPRKAIVDLDYSHCRFIGGRPEIIAMDTPIYCGARALPGKSWCAEHYRVVFRRA
jgi:hypothetical protein